MNSILNSEQLINTVNGFIPEDYQIDAQTKPELRDKGLHIIMSNSEQAILFISLLEEEFDVEFPDEELTLDNLLSYSKISSTLDRLLCQKNGIDR
jgi:acyl carrier protein